MNSKEKKNYIYNLIYRISIIILPLIVTPYIARILGAQQVGLYAFSSTVACYFIMLAKLGLDNYGNRSIASCRDDIEKRSKVFWGVFTIQIITSFLSILIYILLIITVFNNQLIYWIQLLYVGSALFDFSWFFYGMEKFRITTIRSVLSRTLIIILVYVFVHSEKDLLIYAAVMSGCFLFEQLQLIPFLVGHLKRVSIKKEDVICHIAPNLKLFIPLLALSVYNWMDKLMIGVMMGSTAVVAFYTYAENIINLPKGILSALDTVMLPRISNLIANNKAEAGIHKMRKSIRFNSFISCALCFGIAGISPVFVPWFLGSEFEPTIILTMQLAIVIIPMGISNVVQTQYLIPFKKESVYIKGVTLGALTNLILNIILIRFYGASGAVIGTLIAELLVCIYQIEHIRDIYNFRQLGTMLMPFLICGLLEFIIIILLSFLSINILILLSIQVLIGGAVYLLGCSIYVIYISKEYSGIKEVLNRHISLPIKKEREKNDN